MALVRLESVIQDYIWGSKTWIAETLDRNPSGGPEAELWMGAHPRAPSRVVDGSHEDLLQLIESDPPRYLGQRVNSRFGRLPFLFKVLAAEQPLSLQAHPTKEQAKEGFSRENSRGIALGAPIRNYKDPSDKPELICALSPFFALSGFRSFEEAHGFIDELADLGIGRGIREFFAPFWNSPDETGLRALFAHAFSYPTDQVEDTISKVSDRLEEAAAGNFALSSALSRYVPWFLKIAERYPSDAGVLLTLLLNFVELAPGQAMFLPAGNLHAYLSGLGLEVMANSDNVLRGGMTSKHVDVQELNEVLRFESFSPHVIEGDVSRETSVERWSYGAPCPEFFLEIMELAGGTAPIVGPAIGLVLEGTLVSSSITLSKGQQCFVSAENTEMVSGRARCAWVSVPEST